MLLVWTTEPCQLLRLWTGSFDSWKDGAWRLGNSSGLRKLWTETEAQYGSRLRGICQYINQNYDVDGLCRALLKRVQKVVDAGGGRINH